MDPGYSIRKDTVGRGRRFKGVCGSVRRPRSANDHGVSIPPYPAYRTQQPPPQAYQFAYIHRQARISSDLTGDMCAALGRRCRSRFSESPHVRLPSHRHGPPITRLAGRSRQLNAFWKLRRRVRIGELRELSYHLRQKFPSIRPPLTT